MAKFYGTIQGNRGEATRLGHSTLDVTAQSYSGSIIVHMREENGEIYANIGVGVGSTGSMNRSLFNGPIKGLFEDSNNFGR